MNTYYIITNVGGVNPSPLTIKEDEVIAYLKLGVIIYPSLKLCQLQIDIEKEIHSIGRYLKKGSII